MQKVYESALLTCFLDLDKSLLLCQWKNGDFYTEECFRESVIALTELLRTHPCDYILDDSQAGRLSYCP